MVRMLRRLITALARSVEPSGKSGKAFVIRAARSQSSIFDRRISSMIDSIRIVSSIFSTAPITAFWWRPCAGGGGVHRLRPKRREGVRQNLQPIADERCEMADLKDVVGVVDQEEIDPTGTYSCSCVGGLR
jgi:hypothetical protein